MKVRTLKHKRRGVTHLSSDEAARLVESQSPTCHVCRTDNGCGRSSFGRIKTPDAHVRAIGEIQEMVWSCG